MRWLLALPVWRDANTYTRSRFCGDLPGAFSFQLSDARDIEGPFGTIDLLLLPWSDIFVELRILVHRPEE